MRSLQTSLQSAAAFLFLLLALDSVSARSLTPPSNMTGAPGHNNCSQCHVSSGSGNVALDFSGLGEYQPGESYSMTVTITDPGQTRFGFAMAARDADNSTTDVGTWSAGSTDTQTFGPGSNQVGHKSAPFDTGAHSFTVNWTAPATAVGDVTFYISAVAANGNGSNGGGDNNYLGTLTITEEVVAVNQAPTVTLPAGTLDTTTLFPTPIAGIVIDDPDAGDGDLTVTLSVTNGSITVNDAVAGGVSPGAITANGTSSVTLEGTLAELTATFGASDGIVYTGHSGVVGNDSLQVTANDNGNTGAGDPQEASDNLPIVVFAPPSITDFVVLPDGSLEFTLSGGPGLSYFLESSETLQSWDPLDTVTLVAGTTTITDEGAIGLPSRFYRATPMLP